MSSLHEKETKESKSKTKTSTSTTTQATTSDDQIDTRTTEKEAATMTEKPRDEPKKKRKRRPPLVPWKKPKDMPRRPLSAYNIFFKEQRELMMNAASSGGQPAELKKKSGKSVGIGFANLARTIAANWKDLDDETRAPYEARAGSEKDRYNQEMLVWRAKQKVEKERAAAEKKTELDQAGAIAGAAKLDDDSEMSMGDTRTSPLPTASAGDDEPLPLESPKKSRLGYLERRGRPDSSFTPIRLPDLMGSDPRSQMPMRYPDHPNGMDTIHTALNLAGGPVFGSGHGYPSNPPGGFPSFHDSWPSIGSNYNTAEALYPTAQSLPSPHHFHHQERRYTWSGSNSAAGRHHAVRRNTNEKVSELGSYQPGVQQHSNPFPESWFESDHNETPRTAAYSRPSASKTYPDTWFEANDSAGAVEPIRYSPEGDLTGKLPGRKPSRTGRSLSDPSDDKKGVAKGASKSVEDSKVGSIRSLDELASDVTMRDYQPGTGTTKATAKRGESPTDNPIVESSLHALGMQLDEETVDFLTKLRFSEQNL